jgi:hypothetical protein
MLNNNKEKKFGPLIKAIIHMSHVRYLSRNDDELEKLQALRKDNKRPKSSRQDLVEAMIRKEYDEYDQGFGKWGRLSSKRNVHRAPEPMDNFVRTPGPAESQKCEDTESLGWR